MDESAAQLAFSNGKVAMIAEGTWNNSLFSDLAFDVGRFALPDKDGVSAAQSGYSNFTTYAISSKCEHPEEAWEYINFLNSLEAQQITEDHMKSIPVLKDIVTVDPVIEEVSDFDVVGENIYHVLSNVPTETGKPQDIFISGVVSDLMTGKTTGEEAMNRIIAEMNK
jgi:raffinose/stachyose/melibiose transport system substrate-binding protein